MTMIVFVFIICLSVLPFEKFYLSMSVYLCPLLLFVSSYSALLYLLIFVIIWTTSLDEHLLLS